ncbi:unnamed protein product [Dicrocoelium dendriticum]|nr:unnamed protein product [Dicrocoelium dendriticum]
MDIENQEALNKALDKTDSLIVIDFHAQWCGPCKTIAPDFHKLKDEFSTVDFYRIDVDGFPDAAENYKVSAMPTFILLKGKQVLDTVVGANIEQVRNAIKRHL